MADIKKAKPVTITPKEVARDLDQLEREVIDKIKKDNIFSVFSKSVKFRLSDFQDFFQKQYHTLESEVYKTEIKSLMCAYKTPDIKDFALHNASKTLSTAEMQELQKGLYSILETAVANKAKSQSQKQMTVGKVKETEEGDKTGELSLEEVEQMAGETLGEWEDLMGSVWNQILDSQMMTEYKERMETVQREAQKIIELAKRGAIGPEFVLIALLKVNQTKSGVLMTWLGKKISYANESLNRVANDLNKVDPTSYSYASEVQQAASKTRDGQFQMNLMTTDLNKIMQDVASKFESIAQMNAELARYKREIISKMVV